MTSASPKSSRPDQMEVYLEKIANVSEPDPSVSIKTSGAVDEDIKESLSKVGDCFRVIYQDIITTRASYPAGVRGKMDAVTTVENGLDKLKSLDAGNDAAAQPIRKSMKASLDVLRKQYPDFVAKVESCLDSGLKEQP